MKTPDNFFTPEYVDEQVEHIAHSQDQQAPDARMVNDLHAISTSSIRVLTRTRERLLHHLQQQEVHQDTQPALHLPTSLPQHRRTLPLQTERRKFLPIITTIAACLIVSLLVGSLIFLLSIQQPGTGNDKNPATPPPIQPVSASLFLYVFNGDDGISKIDPRNGQTLWHTLQINKSKYKLFLNSEPTLINGTLFTLANEPVTGTRYVLALDASSGELLRATAIEPKMTEYSSFGDMVYTEEMFFVFVQDGGDQSGRGHIDAFSLRDGSLRWSKQTKGLATISKPYQGNIYITEGREKKLYSLRMSDGLQQWQTPLDKPPTGIPLLIAGDVLYVSTCANPQGFPVDWQCSYEAYDLSKKTRLWQTDDMMCRHNFAAIAAGRLFVSCSDGRITAFDTRDGKPQWQQNSGQYQSLIVFLLAVGDTLYISQSGNASTTKDRIFALNSTNGEERWSQIVEKPAYSLTVSDDILYHSVFPAGIQSRKTSDGTLLKEYPLELGDPSGGPEIFTAP